MSHWSATAAAQRTYCAVPPATPPASTSSADSTLSGKIRRIAATTRSDDARVKSPVWIATITR